MLESSDSSRKRGKVQQAVDNLLAECEVQSFIRVHIEEREDAKYRQAKPGRPSKHTKYKKRLIRATI